jgi:hypothetical protein
MFNNLFLKIVRLRNEVEKYGTARHDNTRRRRKDVVWVPDYYGRIHTLNLAVYLLPIALLQQRRLREHTFLLRYAYSCLPY